MSMPEPNAFSFTLELDEEEFVAVMEEAMLLHPHWRPLARWGGWLTYLEALGAAGCIVGFIATMKHAIDSGDKSHIWLVVFIAGAGYFLWRLSTRFQHRNVKRLRAQIREMLKGVPTALGGRTMEVAIDASGLSYATTLERRTFFWRTVDQVLALPSGVAIDAPRLGARFIITNSALASAGIDRAEFDRSLAAMHRQCGWSDEQWVLHYLDAHPTLCPKCGYNLHQHTEARCSECGLTLTRESLPAAFPAFAAPTSSSLSAAKASP